MPAPAPPDRAAAGSGGGGGGGGEGGGDHLRGHAHLTSCIHLRHHHAHGASGRRRSPTGSSASASASLMRDLLALQRSRSLRDPCTRRSVDSASNNNNNRRVAAEPDPDAADHSRRGALKTLLDQLAENPHPKLTRRPRRCFRRGASRRAAPTAAGGALDRPAAAPRVSANSNSQEAVWSRIHHRGKSILDMAGRSPS